ncbi:MAG: glutamine synthetase [Planctomycetes bacterium]|nr:glutamine synthetase [Planctomycetota bacterium]
MSAEPGMLTVEQLKELVTQGEIDTVAVVLTDLYGRFVGKRFDARFFLDSVAEAGTHACNYLLTVDMEMQPVAGYRFANWQKGYGDFHLHVDLSTLRRAHWLDRTALVIANVETTDSHRPVSIAPRNILRRQLDQARKLGFRPLGASELEYYVFCHSYRDAAQRGYRDLAAAGWYIEDYHILQGTRTESFHAQARRALAASGVAVESTKGEWGLGQHELNLRYCDVLEMADRHVIMKQCLKEIAEAHGLSVTFMAKFAADQAGSSCHVHLSLWRDGQNAFAGSERLKGNASLQCSDTFRHFAAGWIRRIPELMVFLAPTVNSYKRFQSGSWAPTRLAWAIDNRTAGIRVVGHGSSLRLECRIPGADCNPYLVYAALLAAGLDGIRSTSEPPELFAGDVYSESDAPCLPTSLAEATDLFEQSEFARDVFGEEVIEHYGHFFRTEQRAYDACVTDWERQRYFERI